MVLKSDLVINVKVVTATFFQQEKKQLEAALRNVGDQEQDVSFAKRSLESRLDDVQVSPKHQHSRF